MCSDLISTVSTECVNACMVFRHESDWGLKSGADYLPYPAGKFSTFPVPTLLDRRLGCSSPVNGVILKEMHR